MVGGLAAAAAAQQALIQAQAASQLGRKRRSPIDSIDPFSLRSASAISTVDLRSGSAAEQLQLRRQHKWSRISASGGPAFRGMVPMNGEEKEVGRFRTAEDFMRKKVMAMAQALDSGNMVRHRVLPKP